MSPESQILHFSCSTVIGNEYISGEQKQWLVLEDLGVGTPPLKTTVGAHLPELCGESFCLILLTSLSDGPQVLVTLLCCLHWVCGIKWWPRPCCMSLYTLGQRVISVGTGWQTAKYSGSHMQQLTTKKFLVSILVKTGFGLDFSLSLSVVQTSQPQMMMSLKQR